MQDSVLEVFREIAKQMQDARDSGDARIYTWCGGSFWMHNLTESEARRRMAKHGGHIAIWNGEKMMKVD